ncbi:MAG: hypothetical protein QM679_06595 [Patulibacter sp.]
MTLIEVLMGAVVSVIVAAAAYSVIMAATQARIRTTMRMETMSRGRDGMEQIMALLHGQSCYDTLSYPALIYATSDSIAFYSSYSASGADATDIVQIEWIANSNDLRDSGSVVGDLQVTRYPAVHTDGTAVTWQELLQRATTLPSARQATRTVATDVSRIGSTSSVRGTDIFTYYSSVQATTPSPTILTQPSTPATPSVTRPTAQPQLTSSGFSYVGYYSGGAVGNYSSIAGVQVNFSVRARTTRVVKGNALEFTNRAPIGTTC